MRKTNIMIEVTDDMYDTVVEPFKKNRSFSKLVVALLEGYKGNEYISRYVNGTLEGFEEDSIQALNETLDGMKRSISFLSMYSDEIDSYQDEGKSLVKEMGTVTDEVVPKQQKSIEALPEIVVRNQEDVDTKKEIELLKKQNSDIELKLSEVLTILKGLSSSTVSVDEKENVVKKNEESEIQPVILKDEKVDDDIKLESVGQVSEDEDEEDEIDGEEVSNFFNSLLSDIVEY